MAAENELNIKSDTDRVFGICFDVKVQKLFKALKFI